MDKPLVSVIMGVHNQWDEKILLAAVDSILKQSYTFFEFIICNDGSHTDVTQNVNDLMKLDDRIIIVGREENKGLAFSLNECIRLAKGKYIARMDSDDISLPFRIEKQVDFLERNTEYDWCGTCVELIDEDGIWGNRYMVEEPQIKDYLLYSPYVHPSVMFRASLFNENQGYLESQETLRCEDYEMFMRLVQRGKRGYNIQENLFQYRETRESYYKRKVSFRLNEAKIRYKNFRNLDILFPTGWIYVLRPVVACFIPTILIEYIKRSQGIKCKEQKQRETRFSV